MVDVENYIAQLTGIIDTKTKKLKSLYAENARLKLKIGLLEKDAEIYTRILKEQGIDPRNYVFNKEITNEYNDSR